MFAFIFAAGECKQHSWNANEKIIRKLKLAICVSVYQMSHLNDQHSFTVFGRAWVWI